MYIKCRFEISLITTLVLFNFSKAFVMFDLIIVLRRLYDNGFSPATIRWTHHYLLNLQQAVPNSASLLTGYYYFIGCVPGFGYGTITIFNANEID